MKKILLCFLILISAISCKNTAEETNLLASGIPKTLADFRKTQVSDVVYKLHFSIPEKLEDSIPATLDLKLKMHTLSRPLYLDFNVPANHLLSVRVNSKETKVQLQKEHIIIPASELQKGENSIYIDFIAGEQSLNRNPDFLYTLLVPDRASTLFPCFDQPNIKASYLLSLTTPSGWKVLAGAPEKNTTKEGDLITHQFGKSDKMSTYLFSFVAGDFSEATKEMKEFKMRMLYRETDSTKIKASINPIFTLHQNAIDFLEKYTAHKFPFQKLDFAAIPIFQYGGMEHVGAIQYRESSLFLDSTATESDLLARAKLISHETSHMWFGDLVTMQWFDDVWMKEVFANFMADKIVNPAFPNINHQLLFELSHYPSAYAVDRTLGSNPIRQNLDNLKDAGSLYGNIIYDKAPIMMRQLELATGNDTFREGIQEYIKKYAYDNARWDDLISILDKKSPLDLKKWSEVWVNQSGRPVFSDEIRYDEKGKIQSFVLSQHAEDGSDKIWPQQFEIGLVYPDSVHKLSVSIKDQTLNLTSAQGLSKPQQVIYNYDGMGYGVFPQTEEDLQNIPDIQDEVARGYSYINTYEQTLNANIDPLTAFQLYEKGLIDEDNELILRLIAGDTRSLFWTYLTNTQREKNQKKLENLVYSELQKDRAPNVKKILFGLFSSVAYSTQGKERLYKIWDKQTKINNLKLNQDDYTGMAMNLALYGHPKSTEILEKAEAAINNPDKKRRFKYLLPALSQDAATRDEFFETLKSAKGREKESWVLSALHFINHPLRQQEGIKHLKTSLELLKEIQVTGDIFFPKAWLNASIGSYTSKEAYDIRNDYLKNHPDLNPVLKKKLLQATDDLDRVHRIQNKKNH